MPTRRQSPAGEERLLERAAVERVAGASGEPCDDAGGDAALRARCDELDHGCDRRVLVRRGSRATARSRASPRPSAPRGTAPPGRRRAHRRPPRRASSARGRPRRAGRDPPPRGSPELPAAASAIRTRPSDAARRAAPARAPPRSFSRPGDVADEPVLLAREAARDERGLDGRRPRQDRDRRPPRRSRRRRAARPGR